jgi:DNA-binding Xre family transcriptional regulator
MSNIAVAIEQLIQEARPKITGADLARAAGIQEAQISRIRNGRQIWVSPKNIHQITLALCKDSQSPKFARIHSRLLLARLQDECSGPGANLITLGFRDSVKATTPKAEPNPKAVLPPSIQADLDAIAACIEDDKITRDIIASVAALCRKNTIPA